MTDTLNDCHDTIEHGLQMAEIFAIKHCDKLNAGAVLTAIKDAQAALKSKPACSEMLVVDEAHLAGIANDITQAVKHQPDYDKAKEAVFRIIRPFINSPKREASEAPISDNEQVRDVLTWAHNVSVDYVSRLPIRHDSQNILMDTKYLRHLADAVEKLRRSTSDRVLGYLKSNSIEGQEP